APGTLSNPYHLRELSRAEFVTLLRDSFQHVVIQGQSSVLGSALISEQPMQDAGRTLTFERRGDSRFEASVGLVQPTYLLAIASDHLIAGVPDSLYIDRNTIDEALVVLPAAQEELDRSTHALAEAASYARELEVQLTSLTTKL